jgi:predicted DNA-binding ribbon-helix-helix protein
MNSPVIKRSIVIAGHKTSVSLEDAFWQGLKDIAVERRTTLSDLVASIDSRRRQGNLSSAIRLFVLDRFQARTDADRDHDEVAAKASPMPVMPPSAAPSVLQPE